MVVGPDFTRLMRPDETDDVDTLLRAAFPGPQEAELVRALRRDGVLWREAVLPWSGHIGAYAALSWMVQPTDWMCLGPVAVRPEWQRGALWDGQIALGSKAHWRFGTCLVGGLADLFLSKWPDPPVGFATTLVVIGNPSFYERCGFSRARAARLTSPYPRSQTMIARRGDEVPEATLVYPAAFNGI